MGIFPFQFSGSILPNSLRSFLFDPETSKDMRIIDKETSMMKDENTEEISGETSSEEQDIKKANWVERLMELRSHWVKNRQQIEGDCDNDDQEETDHHDCGCDGEEGTGCLVSYSSEEEEEEEEENGEKRLDQESFSRFLVQVPWSDTKLFSQLAFLCNIAYVIPDIRVSITLLQLFG